MFRVYAVAGKYYAVKVGKPESNFSFSDWRYFTARLKREIEYESEILWQGTAGEKTNKSAFENVGYDRRRGEK